MIDAHTAVYCVIGNPVRHSMSPHVHNAAFQEKGINAVYVAFEVEDLRAAIAGMKALGIAGASVTVPHKVEAMNHLDDIEPVARMTGAVNTISNEDGRLVGFNTDGPAAARAIKNAGVTLEGTSAVIISYGGTARAIAFTLASQQKVAQITVLGRKDDKISLFTREIDEKTGIKTKGINLLKQPEEVKRALESADIVINASSAGMHPDIDSCPVPPEWISPRSAVFDAVYNPLETTLIKRAAEKGCAVIRGLEMFVNQAALQFERWTGVDAPADLMRRVALDALEAK